MQPIRKKVVKRKKHTVLTLRKKMEEEPAVSDHKGDYGFSEGETKGPCFKRMKFH